MKKILLFLSLAFLSLALVIPAYSATIDLNSWAQAGPAGNGNWTVAADGSSVFQSINGGPTYFVSPTDYINTEFDGKFAVETREDDDYIGFVFGYNGLDDYLLFDWKQLDQDISWGMAYEGFTLSQISDAAVGNDALWDHVGTGVSVLASSYGDTLGWADNTVYDFNLKFEADRIRISIDGTEIFDVSGSFSTGKFGFYNFSQPHVRYQGFEEDEVVPSIPEPATMLLLGTGLLGLVGLGRKRFLKK